MESQPLPDLSIYADTPLPPTGSIRLLQIDNSRREDKTKGNWDVPVSLNLEAFDLDSPSLPPYRCLSYVWYVTAGFSFPLFEEQASRINSTWPVEPSPDECQ